MSTSPKYFVSRASLLLICSATWFFAGISVFITGAQTWLNLDLHLAYKILFAAITFFIFNFIIFARFSKKYISRILNLPELNHPLLFFDLKGWGIMFFMMGLGYSVRKFSLLPDSFIATFYVGLSIALTIVGFKFINAWKAAKLQSL